MTGVVEFDTFRAVFERLPEWIQSELLRLTGLYGECNALLAELNAQRPSPGRDQDIAQIHDNIIALDAQFDELADHARHALNVKPAPERVQ